MPFRPRASFGRNGHFRTTSRRHSILRAAIQSLEPRRLLSAGDLDLSFGGGDGKVLTDVGTNGGGASAVALQQDGKIIVAGSVLELGGGNNFALARYNADGSLDTSFDGDGKVTTDFAGGDDFASDVVVQPDGRIVVLGSAFESSTFWNFALARYNSDGSLDTTFGGGDGKVIADFAGQDDHANDVVLQSDGRILAIGSAMESFNTNFGLIRYNADGSLDTGFGGGDGKVTTHFTGADFGTGLAVLPDGRILAGGNGSSFGASVNIALARYNADGSLDIGFGGGDGIVADGLGGVVRGVASIAVESDGGFLVGGSAFGSAGGGDFAVFRFQSDGSLDTSFGGGDGTINTDFGAQHELALDLSIQPNGMFIAAGYSGDAFPYGAAMARYNPDGSLDANFGGGDGLVTADFTDGDDSLNGLVLQTDGKIVVVAGNAPLTARYQADGSIDTGYGDGGSVSLNFGGGQDVGHAMSLQPTGEILVAGAAPFPETHFDFALVRYHADGTPDPSFGRDGIATTDFAGGTDNAYAMAVQTDGRIIVAGRTSDNINASDFGMARYNADGSLDTSFGDVGEVTTDFAGQADTGQSVVVQPDGNILVAGFAAEPGNGGNNFALARYNTDGSLDTTFGGGDGKVTIDFAGGADIAHAMILQADGKIVLAGRTLEAASGWNFALARFNTDGNLDTTFADSGKLTADFAGSTDIAWAMAVQPDGKLVLAGETFEPSGQSNFALARFNPDGTVDVSFGGGDGRLTTDIAGSADAATGVSLQPDGRVVAGGRAHTPAGGINFALSRYTPAGELDATFGDGDGIVVTDFANEADFANALALQPDGNIVLAGYAVDLDAGGQDFALARYQGTTNTAPTADAGGPYVVDEGGSLVLDASATSDAEQDPATLLYQWNLDGDGDFEISGIGLTSPTFSHAIDGPSDINLTLRITDDGGLSDTVEFIVDIENVAPTVAITGPEAGTVVPAGTPIEFTGFFSDPGDDAHTAVWTFASADVATSVLGTIDSGVVTGTFTFESAGVYEVTLTVTDDDGGVGSADAVFDDGSSAMLQGASALSGSTDEGVQALVVVYDPSAGFVTGGGWIDSPEGAYAPDPLLEGRASFGFVSRYKKGQSSPDGQTQFLFNAAGFGFQSTSYEWLVVSGARAQYKGQGEVNGEAGYGFMLTAIDGELNGGGGSDKLRMKVWRLDNDAVVYDNQMGAGINDAPTTMLGGGSILIHGGTNKLSSAASGSWAEANLTDAQTPSAAHLDVLLDEAFSRWASAGEDVAHLPRPRLVWADLAPGLLAASSEGFVWLDRDADGRGWFADATPEDDSEFQTGDAPAGMDLLSGLAHELGHLLGHDHDSEDHATTVMSDSLGAGERSLPWPAIVDPVTPFAPVGLPWSGWASLFSNVSLQPSEDDEELLQGMASPLD